MHIAIGFSKPKNNKFPIFSWLIRLFEKTPYSHVYVKFYSNKADRELIYHASKSSVHFLGSKRFDEQAQTVSEFEINISEETFKKLLQFCIDKAGLEYSFLQVIGVPLTKWLKLEKNPFGDNRSAYVCSELIGDIFLEVFNYSDLKDLDLILPLDIYKLIVSNDKFVRLV